MAKKRKQRKPQRQTKPTPQSLDLAQVKELFQPTGKLVGYGGNLGGGNFSVMLDDDDDGLEETVVSVPAPADVVTHEAVSVPEPSSPRLAPLLLTVGEVCTLLNISRATLYRIEIPGKVKIGGQVRYHRELLEAWLLEQATGKDKA